MFTLLIVVMVSQTHTYGTIYQILHFKYVEFMACQVYLMKAIKITQADTEKNGNGNCHGIRKAKSEERMLKIEESNGRAWNVMLSQGPSQDAQPSKLCTGSCWKLLENGWRPNKPGEEKRTDRPL